MTTLHGTWTITAIGKDAGWAQGLLVQGAAGQDGVHEMNVGDVLAPLQGEEIRITPQAFNPATQAWEESLQREVMSWDPVKGVVITIYADDSPPVGDGDFNDLVVECVCEDEDLRPPRRRPMDLTIPEQAMGHRWPDAPWNR